jgi:plasmid maintenance system killer protein
MLHRSVSVVDLRIPPANRLEKLHGNRAEQTTQLTRKQPLLNLHQHRNNMVACRVQLFVMSQAQRSRNFAIHTSLKNCPFT